ncbi:MAG: type II toxin-antitoxin system death-on-curing family toxin [Candidatus Omnitrophica bacterium]|jgi:death-on-curing family protein|nr:type II toxin-antitoxin system death-on-curing family toxin [Candidatus Omnitrophota bacterium]
MKQLTVKEVEYIAFRLAQKILSFNEPIPDFATRFPNILESCLASPFVTFGGESGYSSLVDKASILFYLLVKNHTFQNGNKRIAMTTLLVFLHKNRKWFKVDTQELYNLTMWIAQSPAKYKEETIKAIQKFLKTNIIQL